MNYCKYCGLSTCCCPSPDEPREMATLLKGPKRRARDTRSLGRPSALMPVGQHAGASGRVARDAGLRRPAERTGAAEAGPRSIRKSVREAKAQKESAQRAKEKHSG